MLSDAQLIAQTQAGDLTAFQELFDRYQRQVFGTAYGITNDREMAEEVLQDSFLKAHQQIMRGRLDTALPFGAWLHRVAVNRSCDELRRQRARRLGASLEDWADRLWAPRAESPERQAQQGELREQLVKGLQALDPMHRAVILLYYLQDFSVIEISEILECPEGTVKRRLHTARKRLRVALETTTGFSWEVIYELA
jgi:RNA polymerase sigma-70 factor (ECF subfamily)